MNEIPRNRRTSIRLKRDHYDNSYSMEEVRRFKLGDYDGTLGMGEPIASFQEDTVGHVVFEAVTSSRRANGDIRSRSGDLAKRRAGNINILLETPEEFRNANPAVTKGLISRNFDRILKFAITLRNKGRLHPQIQEILDL